MSSDTPDSATPPTPAASVGRLAAPRAIRLRTLLLGAAFLATILTTATVGWLYLGARSDLDAAQQQRTDDRHAEQIALDYAVGAAEMNYQDLATWRTKLTAGTSADMSTKLTDAASSMEQILIPLQWVSTPTPIAAHVRSRSDGIYVVDAFVSVLTKNAQAPDGLQSTATYAITVDSTDEWKITDVGGTADVVNNR